MALPSDTQGADSRLQVRFYKKSVQQEQESIDAGRPIFKDFDFDENEMYDILGISKSYRPREKSAPKPRKSTID